MARKKEYCVRVVQTQTPEPDGEDVNEGGVIGGAFLDNLRYAGLVNVHDVDHRSLPVLCIDILCPTWEGDSLTWATRLVS